MTVTEPTEETTANVTNTAKEKVTPPIEETVQSTTPQLTESETTVAKPPKEEPKAETIQEPTSEPETTLPKFDIQYWLMFAKDYAVNIGLMLDSAAVECWDNPIRAGAHCLYLERDIQSRLNRYAKDEDITDIWICVEAVGNDCYDIYIGYA